MKKDNLATLHDYVNTQLLSNLHLIISNVLSFPKNCKDFIVFSKKPTKIYKKLCNQKKSAV